MDPSRITNEFGVDPQRFWRAGDARSTPRHTPLEGVNHETYWVARLTSEKSSEECSLEEFIASLVDRFGKNGSFLADLRADGGRAELFAGLYGNRNFGMELAPSLLGSISKLGLALAFDVYPE